MKEKGVCVFTWTELLNLCVCELQRVVDPCQHVMTTEVLYSHRGGVNIHRHPPDSQKTTHKHTDIICNSWIIDFMKADKYL